MIAKFKGLITDPKRFMYLANGRLGDSRAQAPNRKFTSISGKNWEQVYCVSCGKSNGGLALNLDYVVYQCPECFAQYGPLPLPRVADEIANGGVSSVDI